MQFCFSDCHTQRTRKKLQRDILRSPEEGSFSVFMVISYKYEAEMEKLRNELSPEMREQYDNAQDYMKMGKWMMFRINTDVDLREYKLLMSIKIKPKK
jgi:hypothetical protein